MVYDGISTFTAGSSTLGIFKLHHKTIVSGQIVVPIFPVPFGPNNQLIEFSYAPAIGFYADRRTEPFIFPQGIFPATKGVDKKLVSYNLK